MGFTLLVYSSSFDLYGFSGTIPCRQYIYWLYILGTYDVQKTTSISDPVRAGRLNVTCVFASNSSALGCLSIVGGKSSGNESFHVARRSNNTLSIGNLDSDNYTVVTFDIEHNGLPGNRSAYIEEVELQNGINIESGKTVQY